MNSVLRETLLAHKHVAASTDAEAHFLAWKGSSKGQPLASIHP